MMYNCKDQNANKKMKLQIWSFEKWNSIFGVSLYIWSYKVSFGDALMCHGMITYYEFHHLWKTNTVGNDYVPNTNVFPEK